MYGRSYEEPGAHVPTTMTVTSSEEILSAADGLSERSRDEAETLCKSILSDALSQSLVALLVLSLLIFLMSRLTGDPTPLMLPDDATYEDIERLRAALGLDRPLPVQYWVFLRNAVQGDFGRSIRARMPVIDMIKERLLNSIKLAVVAFSTAILLAFPLGVIAAVNKGSALDTMANMVAVLGQSLPQFWVGIVLIQIFAVRLHWLPVAGSVRPLHHARFYPGLVRCRGSDAAVALKHARYHGKRVRQVGSHQRHAITDGDLEACLAQCAYSRPDVWRHLSGGFNYWRHFGGNGLCLARRWPAHLSGYRVS